MERGEAERNFCRCCLHSVKISSLNLFQMRNLTLKENRGAYFLTC